MKRVPCLSCGVVVSNVGGDIEISVERHGGGIRSTSWSVTVTGECPACGADLGDHEYYEKALVEDLRR